MNKRIHPVRAENKQKNIAGSAVKMLAFGCKVPFGIFYKRTNATVIFLTRGNKSFSGFLHVTLMLCRAVPSSPLVKEMRIQEMNLGMRAASCYVKLRSVSVHPMFVCTHSPVHSCKRLPG